MCSILSRSWVRASSTVYSAVTIRIVPVSRACEWDAKLIEAMRLPIEQVPVYFVRPFVGSNYSRRISRRSACCHRVRYPCLALTARSRPDASSKTSHL